MMREYFLLRQRLAEYPELDEDFFTHIDSCTQCNCAFVAGDMTHIIPHGFPERWDRYCRDCWSGGYRCE